MAAYKWNFMCTQYGPFVDKTCNDNVICSLAALAAKLDMGCEIMKYTAKKFANSFYLPRRSMVRAFASLIDFTSSDSREFTEQILARSDADAIRADWEVVGESLRRAIAEFEPQLKDNARSE